MSLSRTSAARIHRLSRGWVVGIAMMAALLWRLWLGRHYAGWEESDYGNLAMVRGVLDGGFRHYDMNHMPGYYAISALVLALVGDAVVAARTVSMLGGVIAVGLAIVVVDRLADRRAAWLAAALLVFQPELALYSASSLREPVYAAFVMACLVALLGERLILAGLFAGLAFLVRFDGVLALAPALALHALSRPRATRRLLRVGTPLVLTVAAWSLYTRLDHGTFVFWSHSVQVNLDTGLGAEASTPLGWTWDGLRVVGALLFQVLPTHMGWAVPIGAGLALLGVGWRSRSDRRTWAVLTLGLLGVWLAMGFFAQHAPDHNLYWKWLCPVAPALLPLAAWGLVRLADGIARLAGRRVGWVVLGVALATALRAEALETRSQVARSEAWYRPQLDLALWFEAEVPEDVPLLIDNIPACWIGRRPNSRSITSWFDVPATPGDPAAFARWLRAQRVGWVLWFREDWTQAPRVAPFLAQGGVWQRDGVRLIETQREDGYGWILFRVDAVD